MIKNSQLSFLDSSNNSTNIIYRKDNNIKTFNNFIVNNDTNDNNTFVKFTAKKIASSPSNLYNPLFIYGESSTGKTHLLHAIKYEMLLHYPKLKIEFTTSDKMIENMIEGVRLGTICEYNNKFKHFDVLLLDDIDYLSEKILIQNFFLKIINMFLINNKQIVITSNKKPNQIKGLDKKLVSRLSKGLILKLDKPNIETKALILKEKAQDYDMILNDDVTNYIINNSDFNIYESEGIINKLNALVAFQKCSIDINFAKKMLEE